MNILKIALGAAFMAATTVSFAGNPKETKEAATPTATKSETKEVVTKWFHFIGNASSSTDLTNPAMYKEETTPTCSSTSLIYRCDILIQTDPNDDSLPDLSQQPVQERKRSTAN